MEPENLFLVNLSVIDKVIGGVCRRARMQRAEAEEFAASVRLALIENDYAILRRYEGRAALATYLTIVVERLLADTRVQERGRWHASAEAVRLGPAAVLLESLVLREKRSLDDVLPLVRNIDSKLTRADLESLLARLPHRRARVVVVGVDDAAEKLVARDTADGRILEAETHRLLDRASGIVRNTLATFDAEERTLLRMRFVAGMSMADIARMTRLPQRPLYRRFEELLGRLRKALRVAGIHDRNADDLIASAADFDFGLENTDGRRTTESEVLP
jgi:RNA polymerase sigma factor (sigma-70 family)